MQALSVNINDESAAVLRSVMAARGISATEAVRRAIGLLDLVENVYRSGGRIIIEKGDGRGHVTVEPAP
jgi:hypothetical protein